MNKGELVDKVAEKTGMTKKDSQKAVEAFMESVREALVGGDRVSLVGFGAFEVRPRKARKGRNPQTGETIHIPASKVPAFKPGKNLKEAVDQ